MKKRFHQYLLSPPQTATRMEPEIEMSIEVIPQQLCYLIYSRASIKWNCDFDSKFNSLHNKLLFYSRLR